MITNRAALKTAIKTFLETQSDAEGNEDEYWVTPHRMAQNVLTEFLDHAAPDPIVAEIDALRAKAKQLEIKRSKEFWE